MWLSRNFHNTSQNKNYGSTEKKMLVRTERLSKCSHKPRKINTSKPWLTGWAASGPVNGLQLICVRYSSKASENDVLQYRRRISHATGKCSNDATVTRGKVTYIAVTSAKNFFAGQAKQKTALKLAKQQNCVPKQLFASQSDENMSYTVSGCDCYLDDDR